MSDLMTGGIFDVFNTPAPNDQIQQAPVETGKTETSSSVHGTSERDRKAYAAYREAVSNYENLVDAKKRAAANLESVKRDHKEFPEQMKKLKEAQDAVIVDRKRVVDEREKLERGDTSAKNQLRNIQCDGQVAALVRSARDDGWMTPNQQAFVQKSTEEVCEKTIRSVEKLEKLEANFKQTAVYDHLVNGTVDPATVSKANTQFLLILTGILTVLCLLTRLTQWGALVMVVRWGFGLFIIGNIVYTLFRAKALPGVFRLIVTVIVALVCLGIYTLVMNLLIYDSWGKAIVLSLVLSVLFSVMFMGRVGNQIALPVLEKLGLMKNSAHRESFRNAESVEDINEMLYCYCNHDAIMEYLRTNARKIWVKQLDEKLAKIDSLLGEGDRTMEQLKQREAKHRDQLTKAEAQVSFAQLAIQKAETDIRGWNGIPNLEMGGSTLANHICVESSQSGKFEILRHDKKPLVIRYQGKPHELSQIGQVEDKMAAVIRAFSKMNPSALLQVSMIAADSGYLQSDLEFHFNNEAAEKYFISGEGDGSAYLVSTAAEVTKFQRLFERRMVDLGEFINKRREQLRGGNVFEKVNELRIANQLPYRYQVILILVPRATDPDILRDSNLKSYLNPHPVERNGIIPVFFVENNNIHDNWKDIVEYYESAK